MFKLSSSTVFLTTATSFSLLFSTHCVSARTVTAISTATERPSSTYITNKKNPAPAHITLYAAGDIADCRKMPAEQTMAAQTANIIERGLNQNPTAIVLTLGDNTYPVGKLEEFSECYDKTWGKFKARTLPAPGNHDYGIPLAAGYYRYFDELAGIERRGYYQKSLGNWLLLSLNSNLKGAAMQAQVTWLKEQLTNKLHDRPSACLLAFWHHPVTSSGGHGNIHTMQEIWSLLAKAKADLILSSHDHHYERFAKLDSQGSPDPQRGIRSFIVGTGGAKLTPLFLIKNGSEYRQNAQHGVLKVELYSDRYTWEFITAPTARVSDRGHANCHEN